MELEITPTQRGRFIMNSSKLTQLFKWMELNFGTDKAERVYYGRS